MGGVRGLFPRAQARCLAEALRGCPTLTTVDLSGNPVGDAGALALAAAVPHCPALRTVDLTGTLASPAAVEHLRAALTGRTTTVPAGGTVDDLRRELQRLDEARRASERLLGGSKCLPLSKRHSVSLT